MEPFFRDSPIFFPINVLRYTFFCVKKGENLTEKSAIKRWINVFFRAIIKIVALIAYGSRRNWLREFFINTWFLNNVDHNWLLGFFEGTVTMVIVYYFLNKYSEAVEEAILGLRELGRKRKKREK